MVGVADHTLFLFNPASYKLAARSCDLGTVVNLYCDGQQLFVVCEGERAVRVVDFMDVGTCVCELVKQNLFEQAVLVRTRCVGGCGIYPFSNYALLDINNSYNNYGSKF